VNEKKSMSNNFDFANDHEMDAIASAVFAYKNIKPLIDKVNFYCDKNNKSPIRKRVLELVILKKISIKNAVAVAEKKDEPSKVIDKVISEKKIEEKDFIRIFDALKKSESEIRILKEYNNRLNNEIKKIKSAPKRLITSKNAPDFRERRILSLENSLLAKQKELEKFRGIVQRLNSFISRINDFYILKKLDSLGITEVEHKNKILNIRKNDILLVEDANIFSQKSVDMLKDKVDVIVCRAPISKKIENDLPFIFLNASKLKINEDKYFAFADKKQLEMEKDKSGWVKKVIEDYKREKEIDY
jgi:predicted RNase H-like nuclease (RuvC/YqgF family)